MKKISIDNIRLDGGTQARAALNEPVVSEYAQAITDGATMPAVIVFFDGSDNWLADGFHRYHAYRAAGKASIPADVRSGTKRDAVLFSVGTNTDHGLRRTNDDKRRAVLTLLQDAEWSAWSDREIARRCSVSHNFVSEVRRSLSSDDSEKPPERVYTTKHGTQSTMKTEGIGKAPAPAPAARAPAAPPPAAAPAQEPTDDDAYGDFDPIAELEEAQKTIERLTEELKVAEADDLKAEAIKWRRIAEGHQRTASEKMDRAAESQKREKWVMDQLRRCGRAVGEEDPTKIARAVERAVKETA